MSAFDEKQEAVTHKDVRVSREYSVAVPRDEGAYLVAKSDWNRIRVMITRMVPAQNWFQVFGSICIGIAVAGAFSLVGFASSKEVPHWATFVDWCAVVCGTVLAIALFALDNRQQVYTTNKAADVTQEMDRIEELCRQSEPTPSSAVLRTEPAGKDASVLEKVGEIRFDRAGSPLDLWQFTSDDLNNIRPPTFACPLEYAGGLTMRAPGTHHIDLKLGLGHRSCNHLQFRMKLAGDCPGSYFYASVRARSRDGNARSVWIACDIGSEPPAPHGVDECIIYREPSSDGWATFDLGLLTTVHDAAFGRTLA